VGACSDHVGVNVGAWGQSHCGPWVDDHSGGGRAAESNWYQNASSLKMSF
jgi:hypothetical protein